MKRTGINSPNVRFPSLWSVILDEKNELSLKKRSCRFQPPSSPSLIFYVCLKQQFKTEDDTIAAN